MGFDRVDTEIQEIGDVFVGFAFGDELEDFAFARSEEIVGVFGTAAFEFADVIVEENFADGWAEERLAAGDGMDGFDEVGFGGVFQEVAFSAGFEGAEDVAFVGMHAEHDDGDFGIGLRDLESSFDAVEVGHADVHDDYFGFQRFCEHDGFSSVVGFADDHKIELLLDKQAEAAADELVIIGEQYADFSHVEC
jgi:hypothetical protein